MMCYKHNRWFRVGERCPFCEAERKIRQEEMFRLDLEIEELEKENMELEKYI